MALPASGQISMSEVNVELGYSSTAQISLNDSAVRTLFGISSGAISLNDGHGKSNAFLATISSNQQQLNLRTWALANGWNGSSAATITVGSGVYIWSDSTSVAGLTIDGSWPGGITLVNNGFIMGKGGSGGGVNSSGSTVPATDGGVAMYLGTNITINSSVSYIGGGGGGGGSARYNSPSNDGSGGGGGAGGGSGGPSNNTTNPEHNPALQVGGSGGSVGSVGSNGGPTYAKSQTTYLSGAGGGRVFPGVGGSGAPASTSAIGGTSGGGGGGGRGCPGATTGGNGGSAGVAGEGAVHTAGAGSSGGGGGGGWGANGGSGAGTAGLTIIPPGTGGKAISLNGYAVTWVGGFPSSYVFGAVS